MTVPPTLEDAFAAVAGELGQVSASWLFLREFSRGWPEGPRAMREALGRSFPVADAVCAQAEEGRAGPRVELPAISQALAGCSATVLIGYEADFVDALVAGLPQMRFALLTQSSFQVDYERVLANHRGRVVPLEPSRFQSWAGARSALLTFLYGTQGGITHVVPEWLRASGPDTRTQFRSLLGWEALQGPLHVFPRWLEQVELSEFTQVL
jgi:hypothetical protein